MTPTWNGNARGTFTGLTLNTRFEDLTRAVFEGISFGLRDNVDRLKRSEWTAPTYESWVEAPSLPLWCQMKADLLGKPMTATKSAEGAAIGAAMLAGRGRRQFQESG